MVKVVFERKGYFFLRSMNVSIGPHHLKLKKGGDVKEVELPEDSYELKIKLDWLYSSFNLDLNENKRIIISQFVPDWFFVIGGIVGIILFALSFFDIIPVFIPLLLTVVFFAIPLNYATIAKRNKYFKIKVI